LVTWSGFTPELLSTFVGVVLAIPAALFVDRKQRRRAASTDAQRARSILSESLRTNANRLATLADTLGRKGDVVEELLGLKLDAETWETVRPLAGENLPVDLAAQLARHFSDLRWIERAVEALIKAGVDPQLARAIEHPSLPDELRSVRSFDAQRGLQRAHLGVLSLREELGTRTGHLAKEAADLRH
jgi:hypothetical protein